MQTAKRQWRIEELLRSRSKTYRQSRDHEHPRPNSLAWADVQVQLRHPIVSGGHDQQPCRDQPSGIRPPAEQATDYWHRQDCKDFLAGDITSPALSAS